MTDLRSHPAFATACSLLEELVSSGAGRWDAQARLPLRAALAGLRELSRSFHRPGALGLATFVEVLDELDRLIRLLLEDSDEDLAAASWLTEVRQHLADARVQGIALVDRSPAPARKGSSPARASVERVEPDAPVYGFVQPDGEMITIDMSVAGPFSDFAVEMWLPEGPPCYASVFHSGEAFLFIAILRAWVHAATTTEILDGIRWVRGELRGMTAGRTATVDSQNSFDHWLHEIEALGDGNGEVEPSQHHAEGASFVTLKPDVDGLTLTAENPQQLSVSCRVDAADIGALVAGMIWRSFEHVGMPLTRLNTVTYLEALDMFERGVRARGDG